MEDLAEQGASLVSGSSSVHSPFSWSRWCSAPGCSVLLWSSRTHWPLREVRVDLGVRRLPGCSSCESSLGTPVVGRAAELLYGGTQYQLTEKKATT